MSKKLFFLCLLVPFMAVSQQIPQTPYIATSDSPQWVQMMYNGASPADVQVAYEAFYATQPFEKNRDTQFYKRMMRNYQLTGNGQGKKARDIRDPYYLNPSSSARDAAWEEMGPWHYDPEVAMYFNVQSPGAVHVYTVEQSPANDEIVWAGTATAGLWKSTDKGMHWELMTRELPVTSVYSIALHPTDELVALFGEGDGTIWKTTDGGATWSMTGDTGFQNNNLWVRDMRFIPGSSNTLLAATDGGLFRTVDQGATWTTVSSGEFMEIEFHPTNADIVYLVSLVGQGTVFRKSVDGGVTLSGTGINWPSPASGDEQKRAEIAVTPANPDRIYVLASGSANDGNGLYGIYQSNDSGDSFEFVCCGSGPGGPWEIGTNPNTLGWSEEGEGDGGQYYYDLALGASPDIEDRIFSAGICVWRSLDGGGDWSLNAHWVTWAGEFTEERYVHADVHDIKFYETENGVDMWVASDGGLFYSSDQGDNMEPRMYGIHGTDFWGWQAGFKQGDVMVGGTYHNGSLIRNGDLYYFGAEDENSGGWLAELAGDNFRGFVNPGDATIGYHDGGAFKYTTDRFERISGLPFDNSKRPNTSYWWGEYGNMEWDPRTMNGMYSPVDDVLWRTMNGGQSWEEVHAFGGEKIISVKVAPRDANTIYVSHKNSGSNWRIWKTNDGGVTWTNISIPNGVSGNNANKAIYLDVDGVDPNRLWCVLIGNQNGNKVFTTTDGGSTWQNLTTETIAGEFVTSIAHQRGTDGGVYIGTDRAVYFHDDTMTDWELFNQGLPAKTPVVFLQPNYCEGKIRCAGSRGVHQSDFHHASGVYAGFMADKLNINTALSCEADTVKFSDTSVLRCSGSSYEWLFPGADNFASLGETAWAVYSQPGNYDVTLTVTDIDGGADTFTWTSMITVVNEPIAMPLVEDFNGDFPPANWKIESSGHGGTWEHNFELTDETNGVAQFPNYWIDAQGEADLLILPAMDFTDVEDPLMFFDIAHALFADYIDGLEVWARAGADVEWVPVYSKYGAELAVEDCYTWFWSDTNGELVWRTDTVDLSAFANEPCVSLAFVSIGGYGNHVWVDNVNLTTWSNIGIDEITATDIQVFPNPSNGVYHFRIPEALNNAPYTVYATDGSLVLTGYMRQGSTIDLSSAAQGVYMLVSPGFKSKQLLRVN